MATYSKTKVAYVTILASPEIIVGTPWEPPPSFSFGYPGDADVSIGVTPTRPGLWWFHAMGEEIRNVIAAAGLAQDLTDTTQFTTAIRTLLGVAAPAPTLLGFGAGFSQAIGAGTFTSVPVLAASGFVIANGAGSLVTRPSFVGAGVANAVGVVRFNVSGTVLAGSGSASSQGAAKLYMTSGSGIASAQGSAILIVMQALSGAGSVAAAGTAALIP